ncbi:MAG: polysaccharide deacetylase family protein [Kiritimatiellae bacterium]|nr:polysaccharide deacetylase family protein [Kiritimatiellia bacterium]
MNKEMIVLQCWDDGVASDARLVEILREYNAKATFNLCASLHTPERTPGRLGLREMKTVYDGFTIANHSLTHPSLAEIPIEAARRDIREGRDRLQQIFGQPILGFAYPNGSYNEPVMAAVREAGHIYARTVVNVEQPFPPEDAMAFHPSCHFLAPDFWARYERAERNGVFYFWGHSYEMRSEAMWQAFRELIQRISSDSRARWGNLTELFESEKERF